MKCKYSLMCESRGNIVNNIVTTIELAIRKVHHSPTRTKKIAKVVMKKLVDNTMDQLIKCPGLVPKT
jgi:hypothetical protein